MIEVKNLVKNYGPVQAVKGVSFTAEKGHIYGFLGPNGAGKSTTMNMITGCLAPTSGEVTVNGFDIYEDAVEAKKFIGYLPEIPPLYTDMTPLEYLEFIGGVKGLKKKELYDAIEDAMEKSGITDVSGRLIRNLSKGYKQRVGIAGAILGDPEVVILDEPTVGLDPIQIVEVRNLIKSLKEDHTVILSSHILQEISAVCDYVIMISRGTVVASDTMDNLLEGSGDSAVIKVETDGDEEKIKAAVENIAEIREITVSSAGSHNIASIVTDKNVDISDNVFMALRGAGMNVISMTNNESSLEDVFIRLAGESLDAGAAYAAEKAEHKAAKAAMKNKKKVTVESEKGKAYYDEAYVEDGAEEEKDEEYKPLFESGEDESADSTGDSDSESPVDSTEKDENAEEKEEEEK